MEMPFYLKALFYLLVLFCFSFFMWFFKKGVLQAKIDREKGAAFQGKIMLIMVAWLMILAVFSLSGFFLNFGTLPPRMMLVPLLAIIGIVLLYRSKLFAQIAKAVEPEYIMFFQFFRVPLELFLWLTFAKGILPQQMTFEGLNFDIIPAFLGPIIAYFVFIKKAWPKWIALTWNIFGIATIITIVAIATLSMPTPFRLFQNEPSNTLIAYFPYDAMDNWLILPTRSHGEQGRRTVRGLEVTPRARSRRCRSTGCQPRTEWRYMLARAASTSEVASVFR